jgi:hypothetical protein
VDGSFGCVNGGILGLYGLISQYREAIRYDLFMAGRNLDDIGITFSWLDFAAFVRFAPLDSQLATEVNGAAPWSRLEVLTASLIDSVRAGNWQRGGGKGPKPKPIKVPGYDNNEQVIGKPLPIDEVQAYLNGRNGRSPEWRQ